jgi:hypothetical protein
VSNHRTSKPQTSTTVAEKPRPLKVHGYTGRLDLVLLLQYWGNLDNNIERTMFVEMKSEEMTWKYAKYRVKVDA